MKHLSTLLCIMLVMMLHACSDSNTPPESEPPAPPAIKSNRSVLVYMSAHNNLGYANTHNDEDDLAVMLAAATAGHLCGNRLIVLHAPWSSKATLEEITSEGIKVLETYPEGFVPVSETDMRTVIADFKSHAPAKNYGMVLWGHGSGWVEDGQKPASIKRSWGGHQTSRGNYIWMNATTLANVLAGEGFDFLYFDCCFMASVEVAYQLRHAVDAIVGSSSELPAEGMPYDKTLPFLMKDEADLEGAAAATFAYFDAMSFSSRTCTMSVIRTAPLDNLAQAVAHIYESATEIPSRINVQQFVTDYDHTYRNRYFDLDDFIRQLSGGNPGEAYTEALSQSVVYHANTPYIWQTDPGQPHNPYEVRIDHHCGLTTFIPESASDVDANPLYSPLQWATDVASRLFKE